MICNGVCTPREGFQFNNGCATSEAVVLAEPAVFTADAVVTTNYNGFGVSCNGFTNAAIDLTITGGAGGNQIVWNNGALTEDISGIGAGAYTVTVTDVNGCQVADAVTVTQPLLMVTGGAASTNYNEYEVSCFGSADGAIDLTVAGGVLPYSYNWNNGYIFQDPSGLQAGTYSVTVTDNNGCTVVNSFTLTQPTDIVLALNSVSNYNGYGVSCNGDADGFVDVSVTGGTGVYTYNWSNGSVLQDLFQVEAGTYNVTVTDNNGCTETISAVITEPASLIAVIDSVTNFNGYEVSCFNGSNGYVDLGITGGVAPYSFLWDNGETTEDLSNVPAGDYSVILNDANGCFAAQVITLTEPTEILVLYSVDEPSCEGLPDAGVNVTVTGGVPAYSYLWSDGSTNQNLTGVIAGIYSAVITDLNGCMQNLNVEIEQPNTLFVTGFVRDILCYGDLTGAVEMNVEGGTPPYDYIWSDGSVTQNISGLSAGIYDVVVSDQNGCNQGLAFNITQPDSLTLVLTDSQKPNGHNISYHNGLDGSIDAEVTGGVLPYDYYWSNGIITEDQLNIGAGTYTLVVTDRNGCVVSAFTVLTEPLPLDMPTGITPNGDNFNDYFVINGIEAFPENNFTVFNRWGNIVYEAEHYANLWNGVNQQGELLPDATYFVILEIKDGTVLTGYVDIRTK
jgi:gliding motility-associated-like protein